MARKQAAKLDNNHLHTRRIGASMQSSFHQSAVVYKWEFRERIINVWRSIAIPNWKESPSVSLGAFAHSYSYTMLLQAVQTVQSTDNNCSHSYNILSLFQIFIFFPLFREFDKGLWLRRREGTNMDSASPFTYVLDFPPIDFTSTLLPCSLAPSLLKELHLF